MRRLLILVSLSLLVLTGCTAKGGASNWGSLKVSLDGAQVQPSAWTARLEVENRTEKTQVIQYNGSAKYTVIVSKDGKEISKHSFSALSKPELLNILPGATQSHVLTWAYTDQAGQKVAPGKYQVKAELHAITTNAKGGPVVGPVDVEVK